MRRASIEIARKSSITQSEGKKSRDKNEHDLTDPESVLKLTEPFFPKEWGRTRPQDVTLRKLT